MNITDQISFAALAVSAISLLASLIGLFISKKALNITQKEHAEKQKDIISYLIDSHKWSNEEEVFVSFAISYTNTATEPNSFKEILLEIEYYDAASKFNKAKITPQHISPPTLNKDFKSLDTPINLNPKETTSGWITFKLPKINGNPLKVDTYRVIATSTKDKQTTTESHIIKSATHNENN